MNCNKVIIGGNITRPLELRRTTSSRAVLEFGVATNRRWVDDAGQVKEDVTFIECRAWGRTAEVIAQYFEKGRPIFVVGRLQQDEWEDKGTGEKRRKMVVVVQEFSFCGDKRSSGTKPPGSAAEPSSDLPPHDSSDLEADEIPF